jgi:hypothetical protein
MALKGAYQLPEFRRDCLEQQALGPGARSGANAPGKFRSGTWPCPGPAAGLFPAAPRVLRHASVRSNPWNPISGEHPSSRVPCSRIGSSRRRREAAGRAGSWAARSAETWSGQEDIRNVSCRLAAKRWHLPNPRHLSRPLRHGSVTASSAPDDHYSSIRFPRRPVLHDAVDAGLPGEG